MFLQQLREAQMRNMLRQVALHTSFPSVVLTRDNVCVARAHTKQAALMTIDGWKIGHLWYSDQEACTIIHLGLTCALYRNGVCVARGWNGCEEHMGDSIMLQDGDVLRYLDPHFEYEGKHSQITEDLLVHIGPHAFF